MLRPALASIILITTTMTVQAQVSRKVGSKIIRPPSVLRPIAGSEPVKAHTATTRIPSNLNQPLAQQIAETEITDIQANNRAELSSTGDAPGNGLKWIKTFDYSGRDETGLHTPIALHIRRSTLIPLATQCQTLPRIWDHGQLHLAARFSVSRMQLMNYGAPSVYVAQPVQQGVTGSMDRGTTFVVAGQVWQERPLSAPGQTFHSCWSEVNLRIWVKGPKGIDPFTGQAIVHQKIN